VAACRYCGKRGFSNSPRAGGYGAKSVWQHVDDADREVTVIAMIEDPEAVDVIEEILAVDGWTAFSSDAEIWASPCGIVSPVLRASGRRP
jgi:2-keto-3-deoxy-L-rhamnonate aldolase RhmA